MHQIETRRHEMHPLIQYEIARYENDQRVRQSLARRLATRPLRRVRHIAFA